LLATYQKASTSSGHKKPNKRILRLLTLTKAKGHNPEKKGAKKADEGMPQASNF
jgi:hypothetical protein